MEPQGRRTEDETDEQQPQELVTKELQEGLVCGDKDTDVCRRVPTAGGRLEQPSIRGLHLPMLRDRVSIWPMSRLTLRRYS